MAENWYALQVFAGKEKWTAQHLEYRGYEQLLLLYRKERQWSDRRKRVDLPVFPGYVFCRYDPAHRVSLLSVPGVIRAVGFRNQPIPVVEEEIAALRRLQHLPGLLLPWSYLREGDRVRIEGGALDGLVGTLVQVKKAARVVVSVTLLQRSVAVEVDESRLRPATVGSWREPEPGPSHWAR